jgi:hypothetical protein
VRTGTCEAAQCWMRATERGGEVAARFWSVGTPYCIDFNSLILFILYKVCDTRVVLGA